MSNMINTRKGLDIRLLGESDKVISDLPLSSKISLSPIDFHGLTPKMLVKEGQNVNVGDVVFCDKYNDVIKFVTPASGKILSIVRGEKRRILDVLIETSKEQSYPTPKSFDLSSLSGDEIKQIMLDFGLWPFVKQRPLDIIADPKNKPKSIFISAFDSSPLAPDFDFSMQGQTEDFQIGINALAKLTEGEVHLTISSSTPATSFFNNVKGVKKHKIKGKHPAGNVGTQIHHIDPINKGDFIWTVNAQDVAIIGRFFQKGFFDAKKVIALAGSEVKSPRYFRLLMCSNLSKMLEGNIEDKNTRIISGNALTGDKKKIDAYLGFYHNQVTVLPEGDNYKFFLTKGWLGPGFGAFSNSRLYPTFLMPNKKYRLDTNTNGEERAFVVTGELEKVFPFDILPMHLIKAAITKDIDGMENLGIYEVAPEDFALCEFVCTTKINIQEKIREGLDLIQKECM